MTSTEEKIMELVQDKAKEAAEWVLRLHENNYSDDVVKSWLEWMEKSEFNADEYEKQLLAWEMSNALDTKVCSLLAKEQEYV